MEKVISLSQTKNLGKQLKQESKSVVLVGGCFDILHFGHVTLLEEAKKQADILIVLLESDERIKELKGEDRPLHTQKERAHILSALSVVDYVILLPEVMTNKKYTDVVNQLQPAIIATTKGSESLQYITKQAHNVHATVYLVDPVKNLSTSKVITALAKEV